MAFIDGQNLFHSARAAFGHTHPNYDVLALADRLCRLEEWQLVQVRFYDKTDWIRIDRATYDACLDSRDYR